MTFKKIFIYFLILATFLSFLLVFSPTASSNVRPYFDGEAINYQGKIYFGSANSGRFELFQLTDDSIILVNALISDESGSQFIDLIFSQEDGRLFVYLVNGVYLYKYDLTYPNNIALIKKVKDNSGDYFYGLGRAGERIFTVGRKGLKVWNYDLMVVDSYKDLNLKFPKSLSFSDNGNYIFNTNGGYLEVIDSFYRDQIFKIILRGGSNAMRPYIDDQNGIVYVADGYSLKKVRIDGTYSEFKHISNVGYDVGSLPESQYVYFSDGIGVVKNRKSDLTPVKWSYTTNLGGGNGWAMGLRVVKDNKSKEVVIVFNGSSILVFDSNLNLLDYYRARERRDFEPAPLSLSLDRNRAASNSIVSLRGSGFGANEDLKIKFADDFAFAKTDQAGQFSSLLTVPVGRQRLVDIKVEGLKSKLTYSISFFVE